MAATSSMVANLFNRDVGRMVLKNSASNAATSPPAPICAMKASTPSERVGPASTLYRPIAEQARDRGWTVALHSDDLNGLVNYWRSVLASSKSGEFEARLRRFDGVYRWFLFRATPSLDNDGRVVKWFGTNTDIEDRKRAECLLAGENLVLEMTAKGESLESILESLCRVVETDRRQRMLLQRHID